MQPRTIKNTRHDDLTSAAGTGSAIMPTDSASGSDLHFDGAIGHLTYLGDARQTRERLTIVSSNCVPAYDGAPRRLSWLLPRR